MKNFDPMGSFGEDVAAAYDDSPRGDEDETVTCLERLARGGPALELAIGTGRIGLPLAARGIRVDGIEQSAAMIARLRAKPGGDKGAVTMGDMADGPLSGSYRLVFVVYNTLNNLLTRVRNALDGPGRCRCLGVGQWWGRTTGRWRPGTLRTSPRTV